MGRKAILTLMSIMFVLTFVGTGMAVEKGNKRKGKYTYRKVYKACHARGEVDSAKPHISPDTKTQAQWKRVFDKKQFEEFGCKQEWDKLSEKDLLDIFTYLHDHAADSPTPAKCK
jgi:hypothetical protein